MTIIRRYFTKFLIISILIQLSSYQVFAQPPLKKEVERVTLHVSLSFSNTGEVILKVKKINTNSIETEETARLLSHWFSKILYLLPSPMPRMFLLKEVQQSVFEPKLRSKDNILKKAQIDDVITLVNTLKKESISTSINLYLQEFPDNKRGLVSYISGEGTEQQIVFSWAIILQYVSQNYSDKDISFIYAIMAETIKAYSTGADPDAVNNTFRSFS